MEQPAESPSKSRVAAQQEEPAPAEPAAEELVDHEELENDQVNVNEEDLQGADLSEMGSWILQTLQQQQPDTEITLGSVQVSLFVFFPPPTPLLQIFIKLLFLAGINGHA